MNTTNFNLELTKSQSSSRRASTAAVVNVGSQSHHRQPMITEKPKASNFPFTSIAIGPSWRRVSRRVGDLTAKLYFAKRKLIWEFLEGGLKSKIEVLWSDITAIHAFMPPNQLGTLQIELGKTPSFFREIKPQPRKHTNWEMTSDFTDGHASLYRIHYAIFPSGELDKHYLKLLQCDQNLFELSQKPFPSQGESPYFNTSFNNPTPLATSPSLNPITTVASSDDHQTLLRDYIGMTNHHKSFHGSGKEQLRVLPSHHMSYNQDLDLDGGGVCSSQFNQIQNNPNLYGSTHVDQEMMQIIAAHDPSNNNNAAAPINWLPSPALEGCNNLYGGEQLPELINHNNFAINWLPPPTLEGSNFYGGVTVEQRPELINNNNFAINWLPPPTLEGSNFYGGVTVEQRPELINNNNFAINWLSPPTLEGSNFYGGGTVEQRPELINNNNLGNDGVTSVDLYNHLPFNHINLPR